MLITDHLLLNYKRCNRRTFLEIYGNPQQKDPEKDFLLKLKREHQTHISNVIKARALDYHQPKVAQKDWQLRAQQTWELMKQGVDCIFQGTLSLTFLEWQAALEDKIFLAQLQDRQQDLLSTVIFTAEPSLLIKQPGKSRFGNWQYIPVNIKLGRRAKPEYKLIAAFHAQILGIIQGTIPTRSQLILREHNDYFINLDHWLIRMQHIVAECLAMLATQQEPEVFISRQRCSLCNWHGHCYGMAQSEQHLSLVPGVTPKRYGYLQEMGITSVESLVDVTETRLGEMVGYDVARQLKEQIVALQCDRAIVKSSFDLINTQPIATGAIELYFDIEAEPERQIDYLLGVLLVDRAENTEQFYAFLAEKPEDEGKIWQQFLNFTTLYTEAPIFHYSEYEVDTIKRLASLYNTPRAVTKRLLSRFVDLHQWVTRSVVFPVESYSLKALANWIGFYWREHQGSGDQSVCWYDQWLNTQDRALLELILSYNEDDCRATRCLKDWLLDFLESQRNKQISLTESMYE